MCPPFVLSVLFCHRTSWEKLHSKTTSWLMHNLTIFTVSTLGVWNEIINKPDHSLWANFHSATFTICQSTKKSQRYSRKTRVEIISRFPFLALWHRRGLFIRTLRYTLHAKFCLCLSTAYRDLWGVCTTLSELTIRAGQLLNVSQLKNKIKTISCGCVKILAGLRLECICVFMARANC